MFRTLEEMIAAASAGVKPPERLTVDEAAPKIRYLNNPGSFVGEWDNDFAPYLVEPMEVLTSTAYTGMVFAGPARTGKALALTTPIPTPDGWSTMGDLAEGDCVFGSNGKPTKIILKSEVFHGHDCYRLTFSDGSAIVADAGHKWSVVDSTNQNATRVVTTEYMVDRVRYRKGNPRNRFFVGSPDALQFKGNVDLPLHPYIFGLWLGDGHNIGARIATSAQDVDELMKLINECGFPCRSSVDKFGKHTVYLSPKRHNPGRRGGSDVVSTALKSMGMLKGARKYIPDMYISASEDDRLALLQGLLDTDGHADKRGRVEFCSVDYSLAIGVRQILWSLGIKNTMTSRKTIGRDAYRVWFTPGDKVRAFRFERKQVRLKTLSSRGRAALSRRSIVSIDKVTSVPTQCITVDSEDSLFAAGEGCILTHNSDMFFNWLAHTAKYDPSDMMAVGMTMNVARDWSQKDLRRFFRHSKKIGALAAPGRHNMSTHDIRFLSGMHLLVKWPTITELSGKTVGRNWLMDYDRMPEDVDGEGNAFDLTARRGETFRRNAMTVAESSPGYPIILPDGMDRWVPQTPHEAPPTKGILSLYNRGDRRRWYWRCPHCKTPFEPSFKQLLIPDSKDKVEAAEATVLACPSCSKWIPHNQDLHHGLPGKHELNIAGRWVKDGQKLEKDGSVSGKPYSSDIASFWMKGPAAAFADWRKLALDWLNAEEEYSRTGSQAALKTAVNTGQGEPYSPRGALEGRLPEDVKSLAAEVGEKVVPENVRFLIATIDVQKNRFEVQVHGFSRGGDITVIDRFKIHISERKDSEGRNEPLRPFDYFEDWLTLIDQVLLKEYPLDDDSGRQMAIKVVGCDSGGGKNEMGDGGATANAYNFYRHLRDDPDEVLPTSLYRRFKLLKGSSRKDAPRVQLRYPDSERKDRYADARGEIPVLFMNGNQLKDQLDAILNRRLPESGRLYFANWLPDWFYSEMTAETLTAKGWQNLRNLRNEAWDLIAYAIALSIYDPINIESMDWDDAPNWAEEWDVNSLVRNPNTQDRMDRTEVKNHDWSELASVLA